MAPFILVMQFPPLLLFDFPLFLSLTQVAELFGYYTNTLFSFFLANLGLLTLSLPLLPRTFTCAALADKMQYKLNFFPFYIFLFLSPRFETTTVELSFDMKTSRKRETLASGGRTNGLTRGSPPSLLFGLLVLVEAENLAGPVGYDDDDKLRTIRQSSKKKEKLAATPFPSYPTHTPLPHFFIQHKTYGLAIESKRREIQRCNIKCIKNVDTKS